MKTRKPFPSGKTISLRSLNARHLARCDRLIASGSNMLVYSACINGKACVLKELFPEGLVERNVIKRTAEGRIKVRWAPYAWRLWLKACKRCILAACLNMKLQRIPSLTHQITPLQGIYYGNGTLYLVIPSAAGYVLSLMKNATVPEILAAAVSIARMTEEIHQQGWLLIDIKASNFVIDCNADGNAEIRITDLDSAIPIRKVHRQKHFMCSSETAPRELLLGMRNEVGRHSDVYSIAAMLLIALSQEPLSENVHRVFSDKVYQRLKGWNEESIHQLKKTLEHALDADVRLRTATCAQLANELNDIYRRECTAYESVYTR